MTPETLRGLAQEMPEDSIQFCLLVAVAELCERLDRVYPDIPRCPSCGHYHDINLEPLWTQRDKLLKENAVMRDHLRIAGVHLP